MTSHVLVLAAIGLSRIVDEDVLLVDGALHQTTRLVDEALEVLLHQNLRLLLLRQLPHCSANTTYRDVTALNSMLQLGQVLNCVDSVIVNNHCLPGAGFSSFGAWSSTVAAGFIISGLGIRYMCDAAGCVSMAASTESTSSSKSTYVRAAHFSYHPLTGLTRRVRILNIVVTQNCGYTN